MRLKRRAPAQPDATSAMAVDARELALEYAGLRPATSLDPQLLGVVLPGGVPLDAARAAGAPRLAMTSPRGRSLRRFAARADVSHQ